MFFLVASSGVWAQTPRSSFSPLSALLFQEPPTFFPLRSEIAPLAWPGGYPEGYRPAQAESTITPGPGEGADSPKNLSLSFPAQQEEKGNSQEYIFEPRLFSSLKEEWSFLAQNGLLSGGESFPGKEREETGEKDLSSLMAYLGPSLRQVEDSALFEKNASATRDADLHPPPPTEVGNPSDQTEDFLLPRETEALAGFFPSLPQRIPEKPSSENHSPSEILASIPALFNEKVKEFIDFFQTKADTYFSASLARSQAYEDMMKRIFREKNLPEELFYLALIESGYNPYALSRAKASGIWQFMSQTAKRYGLQVDKWVDERRDPEKSTHAAAQYLKDLYEMFNCWYLAAASYNAGEGKILQAMKKAKSQDFWEISKHRFLKRETKKYVPMFLAAMIIAQDPPKYGFSSIHYYPPLVYEKVLVPPGTRLDRIARAAESELSEIRHLNPSLKRDRTPPNGLPFEIKVPLGKKEVFEKNFSSWKIADLLHAPKHRVRQGETLGEIAGKYRVTLKELCELNQLTPNTIIRPGLVLLLPP